MDLSRRRGPDSGPKKERLAAAPAANNANSAENANRANGPPKPGDPGELRQRLAHVLWLGGSACAGKTTVARLLAARYGLAAYHCDDAFTRHRARTTPARHPDFCRVGDLSFEEMWRVPLADQVVDLLAFYREQLELLIEDLLALPAGAPLLAEGSGLLPAQIAQLILAPHQALWLIATPTFRRRHYPRRGPWVKQLLAGCERPRQVFATWMERDDELARRRAAEVAALGLRCLATDGSRSVAETAVAVAAHFRLAAPGGVPAPSATHSSDSGH
ncbi:MAG TPA: hypothetical protein VHR45_15745 [Thermoanaerobaculia bacterium]|nr:hypothetical protein [Thermoanaerobaculia bacterium]